MKIKLLIALTLVSFKITHSQNHLTDSIVAEGKRLYHSEMAAWCGTDLFLEKFKEQQGNIGGYLAYENQGTARCVFYSKGDTPAVLATITFDSTYSTQTAQIDNAPRMLNDFEAKLTAIRMKAISIVNSDTMFKSYNNTNLNVIPIIGELENKVYILTGPKVAGVLVLGNDYLLTFDKENNLTGKKQLHRNIITIEYGKPNQVVLGTIHSHLPETGDYITATDICTLMLYSKLTKWKQHMVMSNDYISIWDCEKDQLTTITREAWDSINTDLKKRRNKN